VGSLGRLSDQKDARYQAVTTKFPKQRNREWFSSKQGMLSAELGIVETAYLRLATVEKVAQRLK
jgi:hypothetical protein